MTKESKTLFIRNLPFTVGKDDLEGYFSEYGPIKRCFVVQDNVTGKSRGLGYVTYTLREDAIKAQNSQHRWEGRPMYVSYADITRKVKKGKKKKAQDIQEEADTDSERGEEKEDIETDKPDFIEKEHTSTKDKSEDTKKTSLKYHKSKIVLLSGLPDDVTDAGLSCCLQKLNVKSVAEYKVIGNKQAHVKFKCIRDAKKAIRKLHNQTYTDCMLQACQLSNMSKGGNSNMPQGDQKQSRVIVRNLSFKCKEEELQKAFEKCGTISEVNVPTNTEGKMLGFGFVQFSTVADAAKAIEMVNTKKILGRPVAVDWAIPKKKFELIHGKDHKDGSDVEDGEESEDDEGEENVSDVESESSIEEKPVIKSKQKEKQQDSEESGSDSEEEEMDDEGSGEEDIDDDEDEEGIDDDDSSSKHNKNKKSKGTGPSDCDEGQTIFIRNLAFSCDEQQLGEFFEQFGELEYSKIVLDRDTDHSRGMGFVKYKSKEDADSCLAKAESSNLVLQGRILNTTVAVSRNKAATFKQKEVKEKKDARNLHLAREGMIRPGTQDATGLAKADLDKRMKVEAVKRQKLKNLNVFISPLRLCVRNIPVNVDEKQLKKVFQDAAGQKAAKVTECRIMRDRARVNTEGVAKSMGFGFVSFAEHQHALTALRNTNNNPETFGEKRRLIVEFSLENKRALEAKEKRKERAKAKQEQFKNKQRNAAAAQKKKNKPGKSPSVASLHLDKQDRQIKGDKALPKGMPSHWGPKIRHKPRPAQQQQPGKKGQKRKDRPQHQPKSFKRPAENMAEGPSKKRRRGARNEQDNFDKLVNKYKNSMGNRTKWFDK